MKQEKRIGLVLSGGGARGLAHLGVLQAFQEMTIVPKVIAGSSAGAIIGAFIAAGFSTDQVQTILERAELFGWKHLLFRKQGLFDMQAFENLMLQHIPHNSFEQLRIPLFVTATDALQGESVYFNQGNLAKALMASSCIPIVFQPIHYQGKLFLDGGIMNNLPIEPIRDRCDVLIGVHVNAISTNKTDLHMNDIIDRSFHLALSNSVRLKAKQCHLFIEPPDMTRFGMFDIEQSNEIIQVGYEHTLTLHDAIKQLCF